MATTGQKYRAQILLEPEQHKKLAESRRVPDEASLMLFARQWPSMW